MQLSPSIIESKQNSVVTQIAHILYITPAWTPPMRAYFLRQYSYGGREKQGLYTSQSSLRPPDFLDRGVFDMTPVERLVAAGMSQEGAAETAMWFMAQGDDEGLEKYVADVESGNVLQPLQP